MGKSSPLQYAKETTTNREQNNVQSDVVPPSKGVNINALFNNSPPPPDDQNDIESSELVKTIHARSKLFVAQMSPHIDAIETNVER